jgi:hypothetical protein
LLSFVGCDWALLIVLIISQALGSWLAVVGFWLFVVLTIVDANVMGAD